MTIEILLARKQELQNQLSQLIANSNAINGAIQNCDWAIEQLKAPAAPATTEPAAS
jgi:hypothetical protein